jgi:hypothetical protein
MMEMSDLSSARRQLKRKLVESLGEGLNGVVSFGPHWRADEHRESLDVIVDADDVYRGLETELPPQIDGFEVRLLRGGPASLD